MVVVTLACASERTAPSSPVAPTAAPIATPPPAVEAARDAAAPVEVVDSAPASADASTLDSSTPVDRKRCPLFPPGRGSTPWRAVTTLNGLTDGELRACYGEPAASDGDKRVFFFPSGCSYERAELELKLRNDRVVSARVRNRVTGQHCM